MKDYGGRPVLEAVVNGKGPFPFILDTAASGGRIGTKLIETLGLEPIGEARVRSGVGDVAPAKLYRLETLQVKGLAPGAEAPFLQSRVMRPRPILDAS